MGKVKFKDFIREMMTNNKISSCEVISSDDYDHSRNYNHHIVTLKTGGVSDQKTLQLVVTDFQALKTDVVEFE